MAIFLAVLLPESMNPLHVRAAAMSFFVVLMWVSEAIPLAATALLVPCLAIILGLSETREAFASFAHPLIFLFLGGFLIARAMAVSGLDRRVALRILTFPGIRGRLVPSLVALLGVAAFFSMWISNSATTAMMLPIAAGVLRAVFRESRKDQSVALLALAYAASIGGLATPIGSPPNNLARGLLAERSPENAISFLEWMLYSLPLSLVLLGFLLMFLLRKIDSSTLSFDAEALLREYREMGRMRSSELTTFMAISIAACIWIVPSVLLSLSNFYPMLHGGANVLREALPDAVGAILGASVLFLLPTERGPATLTWKEASEIDWGALLLFGGGLTLGTLIFQSGLGSLMGNAFVMYLEKAPYLLFLVAIVTFSIFFTECTSNTATASLFLPLILSATLYADLPSKASQIAIAWACSLAFMLPVATPPNAIVYGTGKIELREMIRFGFVMNLVSIVAICVYLYLLTSWNLI